MTWHTMPIWDCPACRTKQQEDDYYDLHEGDSLTCRACQKEFPIKGVDTSIEVELGP